MRRREFIGTLAGGAVTVSLPTRLLGAERKYFIGFLGGLPNFPLMKSFVKFCEELGYFEGKNLKIEWRYPEGQQIELFADMASELVSLNVDVIVAGGSTAGLAAQKAAKSIPIFVMASHDGVGTGLYNSLARPGGNVTGFESMAPALDAKRVEMLKQMLPQLSRVSVLYNPTFPGAKIHSEAITRAAQQLDTEVRFVEVRTISDFDAAFATILGNRPDAVLPVADPLIFGLAGRKRVLDFAAEQGIPMVHEFKVFVEQGGLVSYGPDILEIYRRGAFYVDKILKGEKPGDIPVEQPTKLDLAINLKTAKVLGITIPNNLIVSANVVIE
jgi:putative ABC transport system substrate-binding protein